LRFVFRSPLSVDTSRAAADLLFAAWRVMSPAAKLAQVRELTRTGLVLERAGLRILHPQLSEEETFRLLAERRLGMSLAARIYGASRERP